MESQPGDVYIVGFHCSGCDWLKGIIQKLQEKRRQLILSPNGTHPGLRTLCCVGLYPHQFPFKLVSHQQMPFKYVVALRHPKDVVIAKCLRSGYEAPADLWQYLSDVYQEEEPSWVKHTMQWGEFCNGLCEEMVHVVLYKDLYQNLEEEVSKLASFLEISLDRAEVHDLFSSVDLESVLAPEEPQRKRQRITVSNCVKLNSAEYEDGVWKKYFTMAQSEAFDADLRHKLHSGDVNAISERWIELAIG